MQAWHCVWAGAVHKESKRLPYSVLSDQSGCFWCLWDVTLKKYSGTSAWQNNTPSDHFGGVREWKDYLKPHLDIIEEMAESINSEKNICVFHCNPEIQIWICIILYTQIEKSWLDLDQIQYKTIIWGEPTVQSSCIDHLETCNLKVETSYSFLLETKKKKHHATFFHIFSSTGTSQHFYTHSHTSVPL